MEAYIPLSSGISGWQAFYMTIAVIAATLAGLMFVALTLHAQAFKNPEKANLRRVAEHTFTDFYLVILAGLFLILPANFLAAGAILLLVFDGISVMRFVPEFFNVIFSGRAMDAEHRGYAISRLSISLAGRLFLAAASVELFLPSTIQLLSMEIGFFAGTIILLVNATRSAWFLLVHELPRHT